MGWLDTLKRALGRPRAASVTTTIGAKRPRERRTLETRAAEAAVDFLAGSGIDGDEHLYRSATEGDRDLPPNVHDRQIRLAYAAYTTTPIGRRAIDLTTDYVVGDGLRWEVAESDEPGEPPVEDVAKILEEHWGDAQNSWETKLPARVTALGLWGEAVWPTFVAEATGQVRLGHLDPQRIAAVEYDPENCERAVAVHRRARYVGERQVDGGPLRIVEVQADGPDKGYLVGDCFYFAVNRVPGATRGHSDLLHVLDWIDNHDELLFNAVEAARLRSAPSWDVEVRGATEADLKKLQANRQPPPPGAAVFHNENEKWTPFPVDLGAAQHDQFSRMIRVHILGALGIPEHWFGEGDSATRATAAEMAAPVLRRLKARQHYVRHAVREVLRYAVDQAILAGRLSGTAATKDRIVVEAPPFERRDLAAASTALAQATAAAQLAEQAKWITRDGARRIFAGALEGLGVELDLEAEAAAIDDADGATTDDERRELEAQNAALREMLARAASAPADAQDPGEAVADRAA